MLGTVLIFSARILLLSFGERSDLTALQCHRVLKMKDHLATDRSALRAFRCDRKDAERVDVERHADLQLPHVHILVVLRAERSRVLSCLILIFRKTELELPDLLNVRRR